jgi:hypothetical protein
VSDPPYRFLLRMPPELGEELRAAAESSGRSLNREIVARLEQGLEPGARDGRRLRFGVLGAAAALLLSAGTGFLAAGMDRGGPTARPTVATADRGAVPYAKFGFVRAAEFDPAKFDWVRAAEIDPATRGAGS